MDKVTYKPASKAHIDRLVVTMREADKKELRSTVNWSFERILSHSVNSSVRSASVFINGELVCIMGVTAKSLLNGVGCPWLIGSTALAKYKRELIAESKRLLPELMGSFSKLENYVHSENKQAVRYLKHIGFTIHTAEPYGCNGELFHRFEMEK